MWLPRNAKKTAPITSPKSPRGDKKSRNNSFRTTTKQQIIPSGDYGDSSTYCL